MMLSRLTIVAVAVLLTTSSALAENTDRLYKAVCYGTSSLAPSDVVAQRVLKDGTVRQYRAMDLPEMVEDFVKVMTTEHGWTEEKARNDTFGNLILAQETLCGGTSNCSSKTCRASGESCVYRGGVGMSGCRCEK